jgi:hypothetical protein
MDKMRQRHSLKLLPAAILVIIVATGVPAQVRPAVWEHGALDASDLVANVLLYLPLGLALWHRSLLVVLLVATTLSTSMEVLQVWSFGRFPSAFDLVANVAGGGLGVAVARYRVRRKAEAKPHRITLTVLTAGAALGVAAGLLFVWAVPVAPGNLTNWENDFALLLGNETTGNRPWRGLISAMAIAPVALSSAELTRIGDLRDVTAQEELLGHEAYILAQPLRLTGGEAHQLPAEISTRFVDSAVAHNAFTVILRLATADLGLHGPARMVSLSRDNFNRNFDVGQEGRAVTFRIRTPATGLNGNELYAKTAGILEAHQEVELIATFDGAVSRIYLDGQLEGRANLAAAGCVVSSICDGDLPLALVLLGGSFAVLVLTIVQRHEGHWSLLLALFAGIAAYFALDATHQIAALDAHRTAAIFFIIAGGLTIGAAVATFSDGSAPNA